MPTNYEWLLHMDGEERQAWFDAEHVDANDDLAPESDVTEDAVDANDETATCNNSGDFVTDDSREKLEADVRQYANPSGGTGTLGACWEKKMLEFLDRQAEITHAETIHTYNIAAREARKVQEKRIADLEEELAKRDKGIARLKRQRDTARAKIDELHAECDTCCYKTDYIEMDFLDVDRLEAERDALAHDLQDCEQQREQLRQALGIAIDHAHEIVSLVNLDGEVIG